MTALVWALTAAVLYGIGAALQQRQAAAAPSQAAGRPRLLLLLVRRPWWLLGIGVELGGFATHAAALRTGPLTIVQMLVASSLLFGVATVRLWSGRRLSWTAWAAVLAVIAGIASFVALASPAGGCRRAVLPAVAAGLADAAIAVVTMAFSHAVSGGLTGMAGSWATYALMLGGPCSLLLTQTAYQAGRPMITLPVIAVVTPVASLAAGGLLLGESAQLGVLGGIVVAWAVLVTSAGLVVLARLTPAGRQSPARGRLRPARQQLATVGIPVTGGLIVCTFPVRAIPGNPACTGRRVRNRQRTDADLADPANTRRSATRIHHGQAALSRRPPAGNTMGTSALVLADDGFSLRSDRGFHQPQRPLPWPLGPP